MIDLQMSEKNQMLYSNIVFGLVFIIYFMYTINLKSNNTSLNKLIKSFTCLNVFKVYTLIVIIIYLFTVFNSYKNIKETKKNKIFLRELTIQQIIIIVISMMWLPITLNFISNNSDLYKLSILLIIIIVSCTVFMYANTLKKLEIENNKNMKIMKYMSYTGASVIFVHTTFMMLFVWAFNFF